MPIERDRPTWFIHIAMFGFGWIFYALGPAFAFLRDEQDTSRFVSSLHSVSLSLGTALFGAFGAWATARMGRGVMLQVGIASVSVGTAWMAAGVGPAWTIPSVLLIGFGGSCLINNGVAFLEAHHREAPEAAISESTGISGIANLLAPIGMGAAVAIGIGWRAAVLVVIPMFIVTFLIRFDRTILNRSSVAHSEVGALPIAYWKAWLVLVACFCAEYTIAIWAVDLLEERGSLTPAAAAAGLAAFTAGITVSRLLGSRMLSGANSEQVFRGSLLLPAVAWVALWFSTNGVVMLSALAVMGLGFGLHFPLNMARLMRASNGMPDRATARSALAASLAGAAAPPGLGALGDLYGIHEAFILVEVFLLVALMLAMIWRVPLANERGER